MRYMTAQCIKILVNHKIPAEESITRQDKVQEHGRRMRKPTLDEADCQTGIFSQTITVPRTVHHQLREQCNWLACPTHSYTARHAEFTDIIDLSNTWSCTAYGSVFNLFSEAEPFAAILIAHRTHVFWRDA